jgi:hypothetical protein
LLRQLASGRARHARLMRGRHIRRRERVRLPARERPSADAARHQQHRAGRPDPGPRGPQRSGARGPVHGLSLRQLAELLHEKLLDEASAHHASTDGGSGKAAGHHARPGPATFFRLQGHSNGKLASYIAPGEILDVDPKSFGGIGVFALPGFARFYRHVLVGEHFPHHGAVAFSNCASTLYDAMKLLGVSDIHVPLPAARLYPRENPFRAR